MSQNYPSEQFFRNLQPAIQSPTGDLLFGSGSISKSWADEVEACDPSELGAQDDGFTTVGGRKNKKKTSPASFQSRPPVRHSDAQPWHKQQAKPKGKRAPPASSAPRSALSASTGSLTRGLMRQDEAPKAKIIIDPRPCPPPPDDLTPHGLLVYNVIRENQATGGITCRAINETLSDRRIFQESGEPFTHTMIGDILYNELLRERKLLIRTGERGGKWRIFISGEK